MIAGRKKHKDILKMTDKYVKEQIKEAVETKKPFCEQLAGLFKDKKPKLEEDTFN